MIGNNSLYKPDRQNLSGTVTQVAPAKFSFFKCPVRNTNPQREITLAEVYQLIRSNTYKKETMALRAITDKTEARDFKAKWFNYVTFSGTFTRRCANALIQHSGLMVLDFDHIDDVAGLKSALLRDKFLETQLLFISPSGTGVKWVVSINLEKDNHLNWFNAIANYILLTYKLVIDPSGKDICRACFLPHDADVYINPNYLSSLTSTTFNFNDHEND